MTDEPDLFAGVPPLNPSTTPCREQPIELRVARSLCKRMRTTESWPDKQRIGHLICASLIAMCKKAQR